MATLDQKSPNVLLQSLCCRITGKSEAEVAHQFQYAVRVIGSNYAPTIERDEFLVSEKIKKELLKQRREADAALFSELHRKLQTQGVLKHRWSILYLLLSLSEDPRKPSSRVGNYGALFAQALPRDSHSTPFYCTRPQSLALGYGDRSGGLTASVGTSGISSLGVYTLNGPSPTPQSLLAGQPPQSVAQPLGSRLAWALPISSSPSSALAPLTNRLPLGPAAPSTRVVRPRRDGDTGEVSEAALVRDILYVFQGIDGKFIKMSAQENCYKIDSKVLVCKSLKGTSSRLAELGWLHNKVRKYTDARSLDRAFGLVGQSFCASLHQELKEYYRLLSVLHSQLQVEDDQGVTVCTESSLTLRRLLVWMYDPKVRLKTLAALVDFCQGRKGGELASAVHAYGKTGDPQMRALVQHILSLVSHPILNFLYRWIYDGELEDTYHEFFVASDPNVKTDRLWHDKYSLRKSMIPSFITMDQARKVLLIGKSINFLHQVCHDRTPPGKITSASKSTDTPKDAAELLSDLEGAFQEKIDAAYFDTSKYLLNVLNRDYLLLEHLQAMRRYLLLGQGDFIRHLMDLLKPELVRPATTLYQHNLTGILETAVRATNAQFDNAEILKRLDVRLLEVSPGDTGWDVFSLDYHVDGPIATLFTRECMGHYLRVFNFLWRAKRIEYTLTDIWKGQMCNAKLLKTMPELSGVLHQCHILASEMVHFIHQMQYYITFEVLECSWDELWNKVQQAQDLDHIIAAHEVFLDTIISRCLLDNNTRSLLNQLRAIFDQIIEFQNAQDTLYRSALEELTLRLQYEERKQQREEEGQWGVTAEQEEEEKRRIQEFQKSIPNLRSQFRVLTHFYQSIVQQFLVLLMTSTDESLRFLSFRLDFNEHYRSVTSQGQRTTSASFSRSHPRTTTVKHLT
ncbi:gamma-tubulin complex component 3 isoform X2 [Solea solea]|uniref:gamma-tubulin complex component 3 isoform X2 n=1 Tax=Solea senegalensis TaxID=28829 RepID=UPI001CD8D6EC|nr:gamma-tubulin complex component 3 isoform X2 [Solea senegalensis]XP_058473292.1 gamma-tubulin complex component 3 isoform X2 [Solea solea]